MTWRERLLHPVGLTLLAASVILAIVISVHPMLVSREDRAWSVLLIGVAAYAATVAVASRWPSGGMKTVALDSTGLPIPAPLETPAPDLVPPAPPVAADEPDLEKLVREALHYLNRPSLAECELAGYLPRTLLAERKRAGHVAEHIKEEPTPQEKTHDLRAILVSTIERLRTGESDDDPHALQYYILRDEYVRGMSTKQIMARHNRSESNLHLHRQAGIRALTAELQAQEARLSRTENRTALDYLG